MNKRGFSLFELLIVLVVLGIAMGIGYASLRPMMLKSRLRQASAEVAASLQRARSLAQKANLNARWEIVDSDTYRLKLGTRVIEQHDLPDGVTFTSPTPGNYFIYHAPYGERQPTAAKIVLSSHGEQAEIRLVGITGKVVRSP